MRRRKAGEKTSRSVRTRRILEAKPLPGNNLEKRCFSKQKSIPLSSYIWANIQKCLYECQTIDIWTNAILNQVLPKNHYKPVKKDVEVVGDGASDKTSVDKERSSNVHGNS